MDLIGSVFGWRRAGFTALSAGPASARARPLHRLPPEVLARILDAVADTAALLRLRAVCRSWRALCEEAVFRHSVRGDNYAVLEFLGRDGAVVFLRPVRLDPLDRDVIFEPCDPPRSLGPTGRTKLHRADFGMYYPVEGDPAAVRVRGRQWGTMGLAKLWYSGWRRPSSGRRVEDPAFARAHVLPHAQGRAAADGFRAAYPHLPGPASLGSFAMGDEDVLVRHDVARDPAAGRDGGGILRVRDARVSLTWLVAGGAPARAWERKRPARRARWLALRGRVADLAGWWAGWLRARQAGADGWLWDPSDPRVLALLAADYEDGWRGGAREAVDVERLAGVLAQELRAGQATRRVRLGRAMRRAGVHADAAWADGDAVAYLAGQEMAPKPEWLAWRAADRAFPVPLWHRVRRAAWAVGRAVRDAVVKAAFVLCFPLLWCADVRFA